MKMTETIASKKVLTTKETAQYLGISYSYLRTIRMGGQISQRLAPPPHIFIGRALRYVEEDLDRWIDAQPRYHTPNEYLEMSL